MLGVEGEKRASTVAFLGGSDRGVEFEACDACYGEVIVLCHDSGRGKLQVRAIVGTGEVVMCMIWYGRFMVVVWGFVVPERRSGGVTET